MSVAVTPRMSDVRACTAGISNLVEAMEAKLAKKRRSGRGGWHRPYECGADRLADMLLDHLAKGDLIDVANFTMMLYNRYNGALALVQALKRRIDAAQLHNLKPVSKSLPERQGGYITLRELQSALPWTVEILERAAELLTEDAQAEREACQIGDHDWACLDCDVTICRAKRSYEEHLKIAAGLQAITEL